MTKYFIFIVLLTTLYCKKYLIEIEDKMKELKQVNTILKYSYGKLFIGTCSYRT